MNLSPIVLFVYNRPWHTQKTIESLKKNNLACESLLFIYSDAPKDTEQNLNVANVRKYIKTINGFKNVTIIEREKNFGLANSIIDGVTKVIDKYGKIIVLEDDHLTSPNFLKFMNLALNYFEHEKKIWHASGWNYPIKTDGLNDIYIWQRMECWGWATWKDRWKNFEKNAGALVKEFSSKDIYKLNLDGTHDVWWQVIANNKGKINTWAIFWLITIYKNNGFCINPVHTCVKNIGMDGSGIHCNNNDIYSYQLSTKKTWNFNEVIKINEIAVQRIKQFHKDHKINFLKKVFKKLIRIFSNLINIK
ncbi:MAG: glycosyltransferase [gamma proteobacterium symbiont of Lucinoma myriamae]|nr:glycosyltransferase [gamma proteobacterium symbiont of Lucinoma myriamae]MCU7819644.1 glycosyltransferase [gamma proteobacterium symbiont of Lucinoma myriamae]